MFLVTWLNCSFLYEKKRDCVITYFMQLTVKSALNSNIPTFSELDHSCLFSSFYHLHLLGRACQQAHFGQSVWDFPPPCPRSNTCSSTTCCVAQAGGAGTVWPQILARHPWHHGFPAGTKPWVLAALPAGWEQWEYRSTRLLQDVLLYSQVPKASIS